MALFKVNTGTREQEVCGLKWSHEVKVPELDTSVFLIPAERVKNGEERLVVLNRVARSVIESLRGKHAEFVFVQEFAKQESRPVGAMNNTAWKSARERAANRWAELEAHLRSALASGRRELRGSAGFVGTQERANHYALLSCGTLEFDRGRRESV